MNKIFKYIVKKIKEYDYIVIARHQNSDLDCLGSQFALKEWINKNYPTKKVYCIGESHNKYCKKFMPKCDSDVDLDKDKFLGICVDVNQFNRIDNYDLFSKADYTICIDHHDDSGADKFDYMYINNKVIACAQIIAEFMLSAGKKKMNTTICKYLFAGISSDSGNFYFEACNSKTFKVGAKLLEIGKFNQFYDFHMIVGMETLDEAKLRYAMFDKIVHDKESGLAYFINTAEELKEIGVTAHAANEKVGSFNRIEEFKIIVAASEYEEGLYRCSLRSKEKNIVEVAKKYGGGGHKLACGVKGLTKEQLNSLIEELKKI